MNRRLKYFSIFFLLLYAFFFASTNFFVHSHQGPHYKVVHSHPWSGKTHNHSANEFQLINLLSSGAYIVPDAQVAPKPIVVSAFDDETVLLISSLPLCVPFAIAGRSPPCC